MIPPEKLAELELKHPGTIIVGTVNKSNGLKSVVYFPRSLKTIELLIARFGFGEELHGSVMHINPPKEPGEVAIGSPLTSAPPELTKRST